MADHFVASSPETDDNNDCLGKLSMTTIDGERDSTVKWLKQVPCDSEGTPDNQIDDTSDDSTESYNNVIENTAIVADDFVVVDNQATTASSASIVEYSDELEELPVEYAPIASALAANATSNDSSKVTTTTESPLIIEANAPALAPSADKPCDTSDDHSRLNRRMTYIGEGLLDLGGMDAIDRLGDADVTAHERSFVEQSASNASATPALNRLQAFLSIGNTQSPTPATQDAIAPASTAPSVRTSLPLHAPLEAPVAIAAAASLSPSTAPPTDKTAASPLSTNTNRRSKLLDFLANDVGERYLDGVYHEETRAAPDASPDDSSDDDSSSNINQQQQQQQRAAHANSKLLAFLAKERGERLHCVEQSTNSSSSSSSATATDSTTPLSKEAPTATASTLPSPVQHKPPTNKLLAFVAKVVVPDKPKLVIFNPEDALSETEELAHVVADAAQRKKQKRDDRERARQKVLACLADEDVAAAAAKQSPPAATATATTSTVTSVDETKLQREKVVDRYGREGLLDFLDRTEAAQQQRIQWATSSSASSSRSASPSRSVASASPRSSTSSSSSPKSPRAHASPVRSPSPASANGRSLLPRTPLSAGGNRLTSFLHKLSSKHAASSASSSASPANSATSTPEKLKAPATAAATTTSPLPVQAPTTLASTTAATASSKMLPVLSALEQLTLACAAAAATSSSPSTTTNELSDASIARITSLLASIQQIVTNGTTASIQPSDETPAVLEQRDSLLTMPPVAATVLTSFVAFERAQNLLEIVASFHALLADCGLTDVKLAQPWGVFEHVQAAVATRLSFRQRQLFKLLDAKLRGDTYARKPALHKRVCVIGAGPVGLRAAVELALLGAQVVVIEKRKHFSRENILHLWPWVVQDLTSLGAKVLFPQFCHSTAYFHVGTRQLQCILLKVALLLGVTFFPGTTFDGIAHPDALESDRQPFYTIVTKPQIPWMECTAVLGASGTQDRLAAQARIKRFVFSRKEAIGLVCYFPNTNSVDERSVAEFSWTIQFKQQLFAKLRAVAGIDLENIVYYRGEMHYLVMTPKRQNLLDQGVLKQDYPSVADLVMDDNIDKQVLHAYLKRIVDFVAIPQQTDFARVRLFDFSARTRADKAASILTSRGKKLYVGLIGDALMEPFWPEGLGTCRGFLSALDGAWMVAQIGVSSDEQLLADRELAYRIVQHVSGFRREDLQKNVRKYSVDPTTRYNVKFPQLC